MGTDLYLAVTVVGTALISYRLGYEQGVFKEREARRVEEMKEQEERTYLPWEYDHELAALKEAVPDEYATFLKEFPDEGYYAFLETLRETAPDKYAVFLKALRHNSPDGYAYHLENFPDKKETSPN